MITEKNTVDYRYFFSLDIGNRTRGHKYKLTKSRSRLNIRKNCFSQRTVNEWNRLPESVVGADTLNCFKNRYDNYKKVKGNKVGVLV